MRRLSSRPGALVLCALILACLCLPAAAEGAGEVRPGDWVLFSVTVDGTEYSTDDIGLSIRMTLSDDGAATVTRSDRNNPVRGAWVREDGGIRVTAGDVVHMAFGEDGLLRMEAEGVGMAFRRVPGTVAAQSAEDFAGTWALTAMAVGDSYRRAANPGSVRLEIRGTEILFVLVNPEEDAEPDTERFEARFTDGALLTEAEGMTIRVDRTDDGGVRFTMALVVGSGGALSAAYWFERAE